MVPPYTGSSVASIRRNLATLITDGVAPYNVADKGHDLLRLQIVQHRISHGDMTEDEREADEAAALISVLKEAVARERMPIRRYRRLLRFVLPLDEQYLGTTIGVRRAAAGEHLMDGRRTVKPGTIRTYYEPRALDALAKALVAMEAAARKESPPQE